MSKPRGRGEEVGYGRPPKHGQFQTGRSGNPKGRPKGTLNLATVLERTLRELVVINENGQRKTVTKLEAAIKQLVNRAASGDMAALRNLLTMVPSSGVEGETLQEMAGADLKLVNGIFKRFQQSGNGAQTDDK